MSADDMDSMYELIAQKGIDVVDDANDDLDLEPEAVSEADEINEAELANMSVPEGVSIDDPVRMYLKEIGRVPLWLAKTKLSLPNAWTRANRLTGFCTAQGTAWLRPYIPARIPRRNLLPKRANLLKTKKQSAICAA